MATSEASFVASVAVVCAAYRSVSWKVLLSAGLVYGAAYAAERLAWTGRAKERATKRQFAAFVAASGLGSEWRTRLIDLCREQACGGGQFSSMVDRSTYSTNLFLVFYRLTHLVGRNLLLT